MNINNVVLVGKFNCIDKIEYECSILNINIDDDEGKMIVPIYLNNLIAKQIKENCNAGSVIGIKGKTYIKNNNVCIIAAKISLLLNTND